MWKATTKTVVLAVAMIGLGTGCDLASILNDLADQITQPGDPDEPSIPGDPDEPQDDPTIPDLPDEPPPWDDCDGDEPDAPWFDCELVLDDCLNSGAPEALCFEEFELCIDDGDTGCAEPGPGYFICDEELDSCLNAGGDPDECFVDYDLCWDDSEWNEPCDPTDPGDPIDPDGPWLECELELEACLDDVYADLPEDGNDPAIWPIPGEEECFIAFDECIGQFEPPAPPPWSPCDELFDLCLFTGVEPALCEEVYEQCELNGPEDPEPPGWEDGDEGDEEDGDAGNGDDDDVVAY